MSRPVTHVPAAVQQPLHVVGPQVLSPVQTPPPPGCAAQACPLAHDAHVAPRAPHAAPAVPVRQRSFTQQPSQLSGVPRDVPHERVLASQARPSVRQSAQDAPA